MPQMEITFDYKCEFDESYENTIEVLAWLSEHIKEVPHKFTCMTLSYDDRQYLRTIITFQTVEALTAFKLRWIN